MGIGLSGKLFGYSWEPKSGERDRVGGEEHRVPATARVELDAWLRAGFKPRVQFGWWLGSEGRAPTPRGTLGVEATSRPPLHASLSSVPVRHRPSSWSKLCAHFLDP